MGREVGSQDLYLGLIFISLVELFECLLLEQHMTMTIELDNIDTYI